MQNSPEIFCSEGGLQVQWQGPMRKQSQPSAAPAAFTASAPPTFQEVQGKGSTGVTNDVTGSQEAALDEAAPSDDSSAPFAPRGAATSRSSAALPEPPPVSLAAPVPGTAQCASGDAGIFREGLTAEAA